MPNPFRRSIGMTLRLPDPMAVEPSIIDVSGDTVRRVALGVRSGISTAEWDGRRGDGTMASPGLYFMNVKAGHSTLSRKATLIQ
jgi:flagellar hook assembly protein FlgD